MNNRIKQIADYLSIGIGGRVGVYYQDNKKKRNGSLNVNNINCHKIIFKSLLLFIIAGMMFVYNTEIANADSSTKANAKKRIAIRKITKEAKLKKKVPLKATYTENIISAKTVRNASPMQNAQTILASKPSIDAFSTGPNGMNSNITFRAFQGDQFSETFDGIPMNNPFTGYTTNGGDMYNSIPFTLNDISNINIYNGINNPSVNSYNSLGGTINFQPRQPSKHFNASAGIGYGSFDTINWNALINTGSVNGFRSLFAVNRQTSGGWEQNVNDQNTNFYYAGILPYNSDLSRISVYLIVNQNAGYQSYGVPLPLLNEKGYDYYFPLNDYYQYPQDTRLNAIIGDKSYISRYMTMSAKAYFTNDNFRDRTFYNPNLTKYQADLFGIPNYAVGDPFNTYDIYGQITSTFGFTPEVHLFLPNNTLVAGGNVQYSLGHSSSFQSASYSVPEISSGQGQNDIWDEHYNQIMSNVYVQDNVSLFGGHLHITPGLKYLYQYNSSNDASTVNYSGYPNAPAASISNSGTFLSPTIGINYLPVKHISFYAAWGRNIKFANIGAYYGSLGKYYYNNGQKTFVNAPLVLKPEYVNDYEIGTRYKRDGFYGMLDFYRENFTNTFITVMVPGAPSPYITETINGGNSQYEGMEISLSQHLGHLLLGHWTIYGNYSYNQAVFTSTFNSSYAGKITAGESLGNIPKNMANIGLEWGYKYIHQHIKAHLSSKFVGSYFINESQTGLSSGLAVPPYFIMNLGVSDYIPVKASGLKGIKVALYVDNIFNREYYPQAYAISSNSVYPGGALSVLPGMPRFVFASATLKF
ncbi:MAG: TonB-dependent receptor [Candidatus Acididesulfobacter diazotrophicus]|uniref:TonB-dependent receptor n=1 Tax=Candidatus Acididesulfobacter diazotrophicus TaxID=2597226 RepID=A0A519BLJ0_9DELT|nr:MAG: TonB-dependent receptor [Candidatus Acididesulfobacter diazotrophicus]